MTKACGRPIAAKKNSGLCFCTAVTLNHIGYARVLCRSLKALHPEAAVAVLLVDHPGITVDGEQDIEIIRLHNLGLNADVVDYITFAYSAFELCCAVRGSLLRLLLTDYSFEKVIFLDSDIYVYAQLDYIIERLDTAAFVLTPHVSRPYPNGVEVHHEIRMLLSCGLFNAGFLGVRASDEALGMVYLLEDLQLKFCFNDHETDFGVRSKSMASPLGWPATRYMFVDQLFLNLIPLYCKTAFVLDDIAYNLGHWNLWQASSFEAFPTPTVDGRPVRFIHFSGCIASGNDVQLRWSQALYSESELKQRSALEFCALAKTYLDLVSTIGADYRGCEYGYNKFANSENIMPLDRRTYAGMVSCGQWEFGSPFHAYGGFFYRQEYRAANRSGFFSRVKSVLKSLPALFAQGA